MKDKPVFILRYFYNSQKLDFPVKNMTHAIKMANAIISSNLLDENIYYTSFDLLHAKSYEIVKFNNGKDFMEFYKMLDILN